MTAIFQITPARIVSSSPQPPPSLDAPLDPPSFGCLFWTSLKPWLTAIHFLIVIFCSARRFGLGGFWVQRFLRWVGKEFVLEAVLTVAGVVFRGTKALPQAGWYTFLPSFLEPKIFRKQFEFWSTSPQNPQAEFATNLARLFGQWRAEDWTTALELFPSRIWVIIRSYLWKALIVWFVPKGGGPNFWETSNSLWMATRFCCCLLLLGVLQSNVLPSPSTRSARFLARFSTCTKLHSHPTTRKPVLEV